MARHEEWAISRRQFVKGAGLAGAAVYRIQQKGQRQQKAHRQPTASGQKGIRLHLGAHALGGKGAAPDERRHWRGKNTDDRG